MVCIRHDAAVLTYTDVIAAIDCGAPPLLYPVNATYWSVLHTDVNISATTLGSDVAYVCSEGYINMRNYTNIVWLTCLSDGQWGQDIDSSPCTCESTSGEQFSSLC